jgi:hypothetical protein
MRVILYKRHKQSCTGATSAMARLRANSDLFVLLLQSRGFEVTKIVVEFLPAPFFACQKNNRASNTLELQR